jgi:hypothetical protein
VDAEEQSKNSARTAGLIPYKPGQSGNPGGRPKGRSLTAIVRELLESNTIAGRPIPQGRAVAEVLADVIVKEALKGKFTFAKEVWDRTEGKLPDRVDLTSNGKTVGTLSRLDEHDLDSLESIAEKLAGGSGQPPADGPGGAGAAPPDRLHPDDIPGL